MWCHYKQAITIYKKIQVIAVLHSFLTLSTNNKNTKKSNKKDGNVQPNVRNNICSHLFVVCC